MINSYPKFVLPSVAAVSALLFVIVSLSSVAFAIPIFTSNTTYVYNGSMYVEQASSVFDMTSTGNVSFSINITNSFANGTAVGPGGDLGNITFSLGRPDGSLFNVTVNVTDNTTTFNGSISSPGITIYRANISQSNGTFYVNLTQSMLGIAGIYNYNWTATNTSADGVGLNQNQSGTGYFLVNRTSLTITYYLNGTSANRAYEKGVDTINITVATNASSGNDVSSYLTLLTNFTGNTGNITTNSSVAGAIYNATNTAGVTLGNYSVSANLSTTPNHTSRVNTTLLYIILRDTIGPTISDFAISPTLAETSSTITVTTGSITDADSASTTVKVTKPSGTSTTSTYSGNTFSFTDTTAAGTYSVLITATDPSGNLNTASGTFELRSPAGSSSSSSGGGGGGSSSTGTSKETRIVNIGTAGATVTMNKVSDHGVVDINIQVNNPANSVSISVQKLAGEPATVTQTVTGSVYRYLDITKTGTADTNVKSAKVRFEVESFWISANNIDASTISLNRFSNGVWQKLTTRLISSDSTKFTFEADTPGFSTFAITGQEIEVEPAPQQPSTPSEETPATETPTEETPTEGLTSNVWVIAGIVVAAVVGIGIYAARMRKHRGKK